jgi:hypothetical protein
VTRAGYGTGVWVPLGLAGCAWVPGGPSGIRKATIGLGVGVREQSLVAWERREEPPGVRSARLRPRRNSVTSNYSDSSTAGDVGRRTPPRRLSTETKASYKTTELIATS